MSEVKRTTCKCCGKPFEKPWQKKYCSMQCNGKVKRVPWQDRFWAKVKEDKETGCLLWTGNAPGFGYGLFWVREKGFCYLAHRFIYEKLVGPIPPGLTIDHTCSVPSCVNVKHMEVVTQKVNTLRGRGPSAVNAKKTHCKHGHPFSEENTLLRPTGGRACIKCINTRARKYYALKKASSETTNV